VNAWRTPIALALFAIAATGCVVGPNYHPPVLDMPKRWSETDQQPAPSPPSAVAWWKSFNDPELDSLIERAIDANLGLQLAQARIREARAGRAIALAALWPSVNTTVSYTRLWQDEDLFGPLSAGGQPVLLGQQPQNLFQAGFDTSWELDLFGGTRRSIEAAQADLKASFYDRADVLVTLLAEVARNYIQVRTLQQQLAVTHDNLAAQRDLLGLTRSRYEGGLASDLDVARAQAQVKMTASQIPLLEISYRDAIHRLGVLLGQAPGAVADELGATAPIPVAPPALLINLPSDLLRQRPDIRRAERQLAAATARVGVATAELYPKFSLIGAAGFESLAASDFFNSGSKLWSIGPSITWPIFRGGQIVATIQVRDAQEQQALITYRQTILNALEEVENALVAYTRERNRRLVLADAVEANQRAAALARDLYLGGLSDFLSVLQAQRDLYQSQIELAQSDAAVSVDLVASYKALGGGWEAMAPAVGPSLGHATGPMVPNFHPRNP
jgi:NodT family efflux transporter outer membrane factor (OMF) lipoprotein